MTRNAFMSQFAAGVLALGCLLTPSAASAQDGGTAITAKMANLRAGPNRDYPLVTILRPNVPVQVLGCLPHYSWCDVLWGPTRGWIYGGNLVYIYDGRPVALPDYGQQIGLAIVGFALADYWFNHYRGRTWYRDRVQWEHRPHYRPPPPPPPRPGGGGFNPGYNNRPPDYGNRPPPRPGGDGFNPGGNNRPPDNGNRPPPNGGGQGGGGQGGRPGSAAPPRAPAPASRPPAAASRPAAAPSRPAPSRER
jgi:uncharacterized protein YraI